jgi:hypothetical protein
VESLHGKDAMPETIHPAVEAAYQLLGFIFEAEDLVEIRTLGTRPMQRWAKLHDLAQTIQQAADFPAGTHVYFGANPRKENGGKAEHVKQARCLFADFDHGCTIEQARLKWTDACIPEPTVIVATGGGIHAWWRLQEPMEDLARWTDYQDALAQRLGSDRSVTDAPRIMRMPGFVNWKYPERPTCTVLACEPDRAYGLEEFPDPAAFQKVEDKVPLQVEAGSLSDLSRRFLHDGYLIPGHGRRDTVFTVACDLKARQWAQADAEVAIMRRARLLGLGPDDLADLPRQIANAFKGERTPLLGRAEDTHPLPRHGPIVPVPLGQLVQQHQKMRPVVIEGLLREGEVMNIVSSPKVGKSWLVNDLAICVASGMDWLDKFRVVPGRVLIIDNELHPETTANRLPKVVSAKGMSMDVVGDKVDVLNLRGKLMSFDDLERELIKTDLMKSAGYRLVILDAFYRFNIGPNANENDNAYMAKVFNQIDSWGAELGCAFVCVHHSSKGDQSQKSVVDVGSGAGVFSRAVDAHLVLRRHEEEGHVSVDAAVRSFQQFDPFVLSFNWPLFKVAEGLNPEALYKANQQAAEPFPPTDMVSYCKHVWEPAATILERAKQVNKGFGEKRLRTSLDGAVDAGLVETNGAKTAGRRYRRLGPCLCFPRCQDEKTPGSGCLVSPRPPKGVREEKDNTASALAQP